MEMPVESKMIMNKQSTYKNSRLFMTCMKEHSVLLHLQNTVDVRRTSMSLLQTTDARICKKGIILCFFAYILKLPTIYNPPPMG